MSLDCDTIFCGPGCTHWDIPAARRHRTRRQLRSTPSCSLLGQFQGPYTSACACAILVDMLRNTGPTLPTHPSPGRWLLTNGGVRVMGKTNAVLLDNLLKRNRRSLQS